MPTQTSQLVSNLQTIYNTKLEIKAVIGTNSDDFTEYPSLIEAAIEGGGGSGEVVDPYRAPTAGELIANGEDLTQTFPYLNATISDNFSYTSSIGETSIEWDDFYTYEEDNTQVELTIHYIVSDADCPADEIYQSFEDYPDLYGYVYPCLTNCTITESEDPSEDGYDYLVEAETNYMFNQNDMLNPVEEITENGFYSAGNSCALGFNVDIPSGAQSLEEKAVLFTNTDSSSSQVESIGLPWDIATDNLNGSYYPYVIEAAPYYTCPDGPEAEELNKLSMSSCPATDGIMGDYSWDDDLVYCCNMKNNTLALTNSKFNSTTDLAPFDAEANGILYSLQLETDFNPNNEEYANIYDEVNINSNNNLVDFHGQGHKLILIPVASGDNNIFFRYEGDSTVNNAPIIKIYNGFTGRMLVEDEDFTIVSSWS